MRKLSFKFSSINKESIFYYRNEDKESEVIIDTKTLNFNKITIIEEKKL